MNFNISKTALTIRAFKAGSLFSTISLLLIMTFTFSCTENDDNGVGKKNSTVNKISGVSQKGPFVRGSSVTIYELDNKLNQTGNRTFSAQIIDDKGSFEVNINTELQSQYILLRADGFYRNEVTGQISASQITLYAIADIESKDNVNINILTHLEYNRVLKLVREDGMSFAEAKKQAQNEIFAVFGINGNFTDSENMSIFGTSESDAALLAISVLLQGNLSEGEFSELLMDFSMAIAENGVWNNEDTKTAIADKAFEINLEEIRNKILAWGFSANIPAFEKYVISYWTSNYGLSACDAFKIENNSNTKSQNNEFVCYGGVWNLNIMPIVKLNANGGTVTPISIDAQFGQTLAQLSLPEPTRPGYIFNGWFSAANDGEKYEDTYAFTANIEIYAQWSFPYFIDDRDNQTYRIVVINGTTWMAENLNYAGENGDIGVCYNNNADNCAMYGRLYTWDEAMSACPDDWRLSNNNDWNNLIEFVGGRSTAGEKLRSKTGWRDDGNGTDEFGFSALPGGDGSRSNRIGEGALWWSVTESGSSWSWDTGYATSSVGYTGGNNRTAQLSVRCVQEL